MSAGSESSDFDIDPDKGSRYCEVLGCNKSPTYAFLGSRHLARCSKHKNDKMYRPHLDCIVEDCRTQASRGFPGTKKRLYCKNHAPVTTVLIRTSKCKECDKGPSYGYPGTRTKIYCADHAPKECVSLVVLKCTIEGCTRSASFALSGTKKRVLCLDHAYEGCVRMDLKMCKEKGCPTSASFGPPGSGKRIYCSKHKKPGMIRRDLRTCNYSDCVITATYGHDEDERVSRCFKHRETNMIVFKRAICEDSGCDLSASFGFLLDGKAKWCSFHRPAGSINIRSKKCFCGVTSNFGFPDQPERVCFKHLKPGMINLCSQPCKQPGCIKAALAGILGEIPVRCADHIEIGMIRYPRKICGTENCQSYATCGTDSQPYHCQQHRLSHEVNLVEGSCGSCGLVEKLDEHKFCSYCGDYSKNKRMFIEKQKRTKEYLLDKGKIIELFDQVVDGGECSRRRPDFVFDALTHKVVLEVDEYQHRNAKCELSRMFEIAQALGQPTIFIRFNPDYFYDHTGNKTTIDEGARLWYLDQCLNHFLSPNVAPDSENDFLRCCYLYYNDWNNTKPAVLEQIPINDLLLVEDE